MQDFRNLTVWRKGHELALAVYKATAGFPRQEQYGLTSQARRCAVSIPANIAEGCGRGSDPDFARFLQIAFGSACELDYHMLLAKDLGFLSEPDNAAMTSQIAEIKRMIAALLKTVKSD